MVNIDNFEKLLEEYSSLLDFYKSELAKLPDMNLHYKKQGERYYACISQTVGGKRGQKRIARDVGTNKDLEEK